MAKAKKTGQYKIPFDKEGNLLHFAYEPGSSRYYDERQVWKDNFSFFDTLEFSGFARGRSAAYLLFKSKTTNLKYCMFLKEFSSAVKMMVRGELEGHFTFTKRGANFGLLYLGQVSNVGFPLTVQVPTVILDTKRTCNRHDDCDDADRKAEANGFGAAEHCHDECCEECFGY